MTITTGKAVHDRFRNKIPNFLEHLPVWNDTPMNETNLTPVRYKFNNRKGDIIPFTTRHCVICGAVFDVPYKSSTKLTCGRACGNKLAARNREMKRKNEQI